MELRISQGTHKVFLLQRLVIALLASCLLAIVVAIVISISSGSFMSGEWSRMWLDLELGITYTLFIGLPVALLLGPVLALVLNKLPFALKLLLYVLVPLFIAYAVVPLPIFLFGGLGGLIFGLLEKHHDNLKKRRTRA